MQKVIAKQQGFHGQLREVGEEFYIPDDEEPGDWMSSEAVKKGKKPAVMAHLAKPVPLNSPLDPVAAKQAEVLQSQPVASAPFKPAEALYKPKHNGGGNYIVVDADGNAIGDAFPKDAADNTKAKSDATAEADRLNALGTMAEPKPTAGEEDAELAQDEDDDGPDA